VVEPGVTFRDLLEVFLPRGLVAPASPGTAFATIGGAVANDVHGKNHEAAGSFGNHIRWLEILLPSGEVVRASPEQRPDLLRLAVGGVGLGGIILAVCLRLMRVPSNALALTERRLGDLEAMMAALAEPRAKAAYSVAWLDALAGGRSLGRGILEIAEPALQPLVAPPRRDRRVPFEAPGFALNSWSVRAFNALYWRRVPKAGRERRVDYGRFLYPLDALLDWNRLYGRRGFRQFQCVLPFAEAAAGLRKLLEAVGRARNASFLAVLKSLGAEGRGYLSFPMPGYTLALDIPERPGSAALFAALERIARDHGGRLYLAKDASLSAEGFAEMYPTLPRVQAMLALLDPERRIDSDMARRLKIRGER
jgi:decaprenylphospho-beta-D-ribofuranose 2-oxidase